MLARIYNCKKNNEEDKIEMYARRIQKLEKQLGRDNN